MADTKVTDLTAITTFSGDETFYVVEDDDGTPVSRKITIEDLATGLAARAELTGAFAPLGDTGWTVVGSGGGAPGFDNSWVAGANGIDPDPQFRKKGGIVFIQGFVKTGTGGTSCFTLPSGYRPAARQILTCTTGAPAATYVIVGSDGTVAPQNGGAGGSIINVCFVPA